MTGSRVDLQTAIRTATERIVAGDGAGREDARLDAEVLLADLLDRPRSYLYAFGERLLSAADLARFESVISRRAAGEPVAHLLGYREFWSLRLTVNQHTLIPRPDTETLVETALQHLAGMDCEAPRVLDLGTGTGAIALAIAAERNDAVVLATDFLSEVVALAEKNRQRLAIQNMAVKLSDWFSAIEGKFHLIVSNPPYLEAGDPHLFQGDLRYEPRSALESGASGLDALVHIIDGAPEYLLPGGRLLVEHGWTQGPAVRAALTKAGFKAIETRNDLAGRERVSGGQR